MTTEDIRWLQRFENLTKVFKDLEDRIFYIGDVDKYLKNYLNEKQKYEELPLEILKEDIENDNYKQEQLLQKEAMLDSLIQKYEITYEMFIKTFRDLLSYQGEKLIELGNKEILKHSLRLNYIQEHDTWKEINDHRNQTSHDYHNDDKRLEITAKIVKEHYTAMKKSYQVLKQKSEQQED